ncbi:MAG TPA: discoidin domain-containing protein [Verrucomicrobiae bacterium]|nr:discoidin domain-containing protein [Verrucomicrobiae bacterium]
MTRALCWLFCVLPLLARGGSQDLYLQSLTNFESYGETIWHSATYSGAPPDAGYWGDGATTGNGGVRGNAGVALAYAVMVLAQPASTNNPTRLNHIRQALNYNAGTHTTGSYVAEDGKQWGWDTGAVGTCAQTGSDWQTALWAAPTAFACFLQQSNLPAATIQAVQTMLISEANHRATVPPCSGWVGDTKAEENGWDGNVVVCAAAWLSKNTNFSAWLASSESYLANTYTIDTTVGDPLASSVTTITAYPDWAIENHGFFHPEYAMVAGEEMGDSWLMARYMNTNVSAQLEPFADHNVLNEWYSLNRSIFGWGELAYPAGEDWALHDYGENSYMAWLAAHFNDPVGWFADNNISQLERYRQSINGNGQFVGPSAGGFYREAVQAYRTGMAWLQWQAADYQSSLATPPPVSFEWLPDVDIIVQRCSNYYCSISYGPQTNGSPSKIMAMIDPPFISVPSNVYFTTPREPGIIGLGSMGYPTSGGVVSLVTNAGGFTAELRLTNGSVGTTEVYMNSTGASVGIVEVPYPVASLTTTQGSFCVGIQNDPLSGGTRLLQWTNASQTVTNRTGVSVNMTNDWVCVAGRYGVAAGPAGYFNYQAASGYTRLNEVGGLNESGVAEDTLQYMPTNPATPRYAVWFPGNSPAQTASNAAQISWSVKGSNATLTFPGIGGAPAQIIAVVPPALLYPAYAVSVSNVTASSSQSGYPPTNAVDGNASTFWVSSGTAAGQGPTPAHPEWLAVTFPREVAVAEFQVAPRTVNGGYGPKAIQMWLNGATVYSGTMAATSALDVPLYPPIYATNAELYITSSYDPSYPTDSRNVQVVEMTFYERALPGSYADWEMQTFTSSELTNSVYEGPLADPDADGVPNIIEYAVGGDPLAPDAALIQIQAAPAPSGQFALEFHKRKNVSGVTFVTENSTDLVNWSFVQPLSETNISDLGNAWLVRANFPLQVAPGYFRIQYFSPDL